MTANRLKPLSERFYRRDAETLARDLLGRLLVRHQKGRRRAVARIIEVEAYLGSIDAASHAYDGRRTERTSTMYLAGGIAYVYLIYGIHNCLNVVAGRAGKAEAVLIRAVEPIEGEEWMRQNRGLENSGRPGSIGGGPGKLCQAFGIDRSFNGCSLRQGDLILTRGSRVQPEEIAAGPRIGVDYAGEAAAWPLRFAIANHRAMSRPLLG